MSSAISIFQVTLAFQLCNLGFCSSVTNFLFSKYFLFLNVTTVDSVVLHNLLIKAVNDVLFLFCTLM